jgi:hypothetical protein
MTELPRSNNRTDIDDDLFLQRARNVQAIIEELPQLGKFLPLIDKIVSDRRLLIRTMLSIAHLDNPADGAEVALTVLRNIGYID